MNKQLKLALATTAIIGALGMGAQQSLAATADGTLGATSTGTADVTLSIAEQFQITNMDAIALGAYGGTGDLSGNDDICIYHNGDGSYRVTISDDSTMTASGFYVQDAGATIEIPYEVNWNDESGTTNNLNVVDGSPTASQSGANTTHADCSGGVGLSANLEVVLAEADLQAAPAGSYDAEITIVVEQD